MAPEAERLSRGNSNINSSSRSDSSQTEDYQNEAASLESRLKALFDEEFGSSKEGVILYQKSFVLLLSWDSKVDDLHTEAEVSALKEVLERTFHFKTERKVLHQGPGPTPQAQVNLILSQFVVDHDHDANTLLIVYYAGHGRAGESTGGLKLAGDVLVIFDCCHAGELERSVRSNGNHRAFEYLAATSANGTTRKPGENSFTSALIWALNKLATTGKSFTTQELLTKIPHYEHFPNDQYPRLSERGPARGCSRRIVLAPVSPNAPKPLEAKRHTEETVTREDLTLRLVFNKPITEQVTKSLAAELRGIFSRGDLQGTNILWEGMNVSNSPNFDYFTAKFYAKRWLAHTRKKSSNSGLVDTTPQLEDSVAISADESRIATPYLDRPVSEPLFASNDSQIGTGTPLELIVDTSKVRGEEGLLSSSLSPISPLTSKKRKRETGSNRGYEPQLEKPGGSVSTSKRRSSRGTKI